MKYLKTVIQSIKQHTGSKEELQQLIWELICYSPKMAARLHQQELMNVAEQIQLQTYDQYFSKKTLSFPSYSWGTGTRTVVIVHGWGSKSLDFYDLIKGLLTLPDVRVIAFDAPGNGLAEGHLSNLFLFVEAIKGIERHYGMAEIMIGHSLGGMAAIRYLHETKTYPKHLITLAPLINLKENFKGSMTGVGISEADQQQFFEEFEALYGQSTTDFHVEKMYDFDGKIEHTLIYEEQDLVAPASDIEDFLQQHTGVKAIKYDHTSHAKIISDQQVILEIQQLINGNLN